MDKSVAIGLGAVGAYASYHYWRTRAASQLPLPPSPKSYPLIGNLLSMPTRDEHLGFIKIGEELHSDVISLSILGTVIVVLNKAEDAINLLEKRSNIYSDRPPFPMITEPSLMDWGNLTAVTRYGERWRKSRRMMHRCLERQAAEIFHPSQERQSRLLLQRLLAASGHLDSSEDLELEVYRATAGTIMCSIYGFKTEDLSDTFMLKIKQCMDNLTNASLPSNFLVNVFPALVRVPDWFPWTEWKRTGRKWKEQKNDAVDSTYYWTKSAMEKEGHESSMIESMLKQAKQLGINSSERDELVKNIAFGLLGAGADTSVSSILTFFTAMLLYPNIQQAAQEEVDRVVGTERLPTMKDRMNLPYIERLVKEVLRWRPPLPSGVPHACYEDDTYNNYRIPKGAIVIGNVWAISHNAEVYKNPEMFDPDRFLDPSVPIPPTFGFGRRICPGLHYAGASLFICVSLILSVFKIERARDKEGNEILPVPQNAENAAVYHPLPFKFKLVPRSSAHEHLIQTGA